MLEGDFNLGLFSLLAGRRGGARGRWVWAEVSLFIVGATEGCVAFGRGRFVGELVLIGLYIWGLFCA